MKTYSHVQPKTGELTTWHAFDALFGGIGFIVTTPRMWGYALVPAVMLILVSLGFTALAIWGAAEFSYTIFGPDRRTWGTIGYYAVTVLLVVVGFLIAVLLGLVLAEPLSGFALERIAQGQQRKLTGNAPASMPLLKSLWLSGSAVAFAVIPGGTAIVILLTINLFYPPAAVVTVPLKLLVCAWLLAWDFLDYPLGLRGLGIRARLRWVFRNFGAFTLFGLCWALCAILPGVVLVLLPMGVAGATRMVLLDDPQAATNLPQPPLPTAQLSSSAHLLK